MAINIDYLHLPERTVLNNRYLIKKKLSNRTNFSIPYLAYDKLKKRKVVIKEFFPKSFVLRELDAKTVTFKNKAAEKKFNQEKKMFAKEARVINRFQSQNIVKCYSYFIENMTCYIVLKYYSGPTLKKYLKSKKMNFVEFARDIFFPLLDTIDLIHQQNYIHGDLKPDNIVIYKGKPVILDFGSAINYKEEKNRRIFVSPGYSPLEFYSTTSRKGPFSDIYSLSAILYYFFTKKVALEAKNRFFTDGLKDIRLINSEISDYFNNFILRNLSLKAVKRDNSINSYKRKILIEYYRQLGSKILKSILNFSRQLARLS